MRKLFLCAILGVLLGSGCGEAKKKTTKKNQALNITVLLDLSDRVNPKKYPNKPEHFERDVAIVKYITTLFKRSISAKGAFAAKGKMKVVFSPRPDDDEINRIAQELSADFSGKKPAEKKQIYDRISSGFERNLQKIYSKTIKTNHYPGSDVWRFFKNDVGDYAVLDDENYRNVLVILTDGYLYHDLSRGTKGNRSMSLSPQQLKRRGLRSKNWMEKFEKKDYGYITPETDLSNLDILVLEINPSNNHKNDEDVIKAYLKKWFTEMKVRYFKFYNTDLPQHTKLRIDKFFKHSK